MDFESIHNFLILSDTLNYSKAAEDLHITQPTLTKCIHRLEAELGKQLFFRSHRGVSLTPEGEIVQKNFKRITAQMTQLQDELESPAESQTYQLRVGFLSHTMQLYFPGFFREFRKRYPNITVHLIEGDQSSLIDSYISGSLDIYIGTEGARAALPHCNVIEVNQEPIYMLVPTESDYAKLTSVDMDDMKNENFILLGNSISYLTPQYSRNNLTMRICEQHNFHPNIIPCRYFHNIPLLVACGKGVSVVSSAAKFYGRGCVTFVPITGHENDVLKINAYYDNFKKDLSELFAMELREFIKKKKSESNA